MRIGLNDLPPAIGDLLKARMWNLRFSHSTRAEDLEARQVIGRRWKGLGWRILAAVPAGAILGAAAAAALGANGGGVTGAAIMTGYFAGIGTGVGSILMARFARNVTVTAEELRALSSGLDLGRAETIYLDTVCALLEAGDNVSEQTGRDIVSTLNELLMKAQDVSSRLERLQKAAGADSLPALEDERRQLSERIPIARDDQARGDLTQSLAICDERLTNARALAPLVERMDAQREVMLQTLLSVQSAVSRLQVAPTAVTAPDVEAVRRVMTDVTAQTNAVEEAVQEVMAVHS